MLIIQDARTSRRPANRTAQLTVWDVLSLSSDEDSKAGGFEVGQRFMVYFSHRKPSLLYFLTIAALTLGYEFVTHASKCMDGLCPWIGSVPVHKTRHKMDTN